MSRSALALLLFLAALMVLAITGVLDDLIAMSR